VFSKLCAIAAAVAVAALVHSAAHCYSVNLLLSTRCHNAAHLRLLLLTTAAIATVMMLDLPTFIGALLIEARSVKSKSVLQSAAASCTAEVRVQLQITAAAAATAVEALSAPVPQT
jgi:hypothetical protein